MSLVGHFGADPLRCEEYGYGLGSPHGILVLKYHSASALDFGETRQDFLHQLYWSPDGVLSTWRGADARFVGAGEAYWVHRGVTHGVRAADRQTVYRVCLREVPPSLEGVSAGVVPIDEEAVRLVRAIGRPGQDEGEAIAARARIMTGLGVPDQEDQVRRTSGSGVAMTVARTLSRDLGETVHLEEWAQRLHVSVKTLQRDFAREFGMSYSEWRSQVRLRASRVLLETQPVSEVARRVGYATPSAFITAFAREYGCTPGRYAARNG